MSFNGTKMWYESKGVIASNLNSVAAVLAMGGITFGEGAIDETAAIIYLVCQAVLGVVGLVGRIRAGTYIKWRK